MGGSFFEIPETERIRLINETNNHQTVTDIFFESRPELITDENVKQIKQLIPNKRLSIAIGLESSDDEIRNKVHKKGFSNVQFLKALNILKQNAVRSLAYVFVKPPIADITDEEASREAYATIKYCFDHGADSVELECGYIVENSEMQTLYDAGHYKTLSLWTIRELLLRSLEMENAGIIRLAYFTDTPVPLDVPKNCEKCNGIFLDMFKEYRETLNVMALKKDVRCDCQKDVSI